MEINEAMNKNINTFLFLDKIKDIIALENQKTLAEVNKMIVMENQKVLNRIYNLDDKFSDKFNYIQNTLDDLNNNKVENDDYQEKKSIKKFRKIKYQLKSLSEYLLENINIIKYDVSNLDSMDSRIRTISDTLNEGINSMTRRQIDDSVHAEIKEVRELLLDAKGYN